MTGAVDVSIVTFFRLILNVSDRDGNGFGCVTDRTALGDISIGLNLSQTFLGLNGQNGRRQSGLPVVNVADGADIDVSLSTFEIFFSHLLLLKFTKCVTETNTR